MNLKKINNFLGYSLYIVGASRIVLIILAFLKFGKNISGIINNSGVTGSNIITLFSGLIGIAQIILAIASVIMLVISLNNEPKAAKGYACAICAILIEFFVPSFLMLFFIFVECSLYMKAGTILVKLNSGDSKNTKRNEELAKNTEWFFDEKREEERIKRIEEQQEKNKENIEENFVETKGISISTILIAWIVIIAVLLVVYLIQDMVNDNKNVEEVNNVFVQNTIINTNIISNTTGESKDRIPVKNTTITSSLPEEKETDSRLIKIVNEFNSSDASTYMLAQGYVLTAIATGNNITVLGSGDGINTTVVFTLEGDILSTVIVNDTKNPQKPVLEILHAMSLLDSIGEYKGYPERTIINEFDKEESKYYTVENEGIEIKQDSDTGNAIIKVDLNKSFSFLNDD